MHSIQALAAVVVAAATLAQGQSIDPNSVPIGTRQQWCNSQISSCPLLCLQITDPQSASTIQNSCDVTTLTYGCVCENGQQPNVSEYSQTLPYFLCTEQDNNCVNACASSDSACQSACRTNNPCGAQNPIRVNTTSSAATATKTGSGSAASSSGSGGTAVYTGFGGASETGSGSASGSGSDSGSSSSSTSKSNGAASMLEFGQIYGLSLMATGFFAGFMMLL